jgi:glycerol-3-phosphate dehydrogenase (NAD(P)+)
MSASSTAARPGVTVLGGGSWGTAVAALIAHAGHPVTLWVRDGKQAAAMRRSRKNARYLPGLQLPRTIRITHDLVDAVQDVPVLFFVIPSKAFRAVAAAVGGHLDPAQVAIHGTKGFEPETRDRMSRILEQETCLKQIGVLSGPNIAPEIAGGLPAGAVIASRFPRVISETRRLMVSDRFRVYDSRDVVGVELAGALKNVIAIVSGAAAGMDLGENVRAMLITRGLAEIARLGTALGADPLTFSGLAGMGDLIVTCASPLSRNHRVGRGMAGGMSLDAVVASLGMVAEGVGTTRIAYEIARELDIDAPMTGAVYRVLFEGLAPDVALSQLMARSPRPDMDPVLFGGDR